MLLGFALVLFVLLIVVHEYGHFIAAKRNGVDVEEFGIGFPPKVVGKTFGKGIFRSYYTINLLPLGGFVRLKGESDSATGKGTFGAASFWIKTKIILAGVLMNFVSAVLLFTLLALTGMPRMLDNQYTVASDETVTRDEVVAATVEEGSPAFGAGVRPGDTIVQINDVVIEDAAHLFKVTEEHQEQLVAVEYVQDGQEKSAQVQFNGPDSDDGFFGVGPANLELRRYGWSAPLVGLGTTLQFGQLTYEGLGTVVSSLFSAEFSEAGDQVSGPVGIVFVINNISLFGISYVVYFMAVISLTLAIMNALPIPALDGGRLFVSGIYKLLKKPLTEEVEQRIHGTGFAVLMGLIVLITIVDIRRFF